MCIHIIFSNFSTKTYVVCTVPGQGTSNEYHNICFCREIREMSTFLLKKNNLIWSYVIRNAPANDVIGACYKCLGKALLMSICNIGFYKEKICTGLDIPYTCTRVVQ